MNRRVRRAAAALVLAAVSACGRAAPSAHAPAGPTPLAAAPSAPAWSAGELAALQSQLRAAFGASALATSGIAVVDGNGRPLFARRERTPMTPASTFKVLVGATALQTLGPDFRFSTTLESVDDPADGKIRGDVYLVGTGDPLLTRDDLRGGVAAVARAGVRDVSGAIVADASVFAGAEQNRAWEPDDLQYGYAAGTSALSLDQGTVEFHLVPTSVGAPARIRVLPPSSAVRVMGGVDHVVRDAADDSARSRLRNDFTFSGRVAAGAEQSFWRPVIDLPRYAADVARTMLRERGVSVDGGVEHRRRAGRAVRAVAPSLAEAARRRARDDDRVQQPFRRTALRAVGATRGVGHRSQRRAGGARDPRARRRPAGRPAHRRRQRARADATASRRSRSRCCSRAPRSNRRARSSSARCRASASKGRCGGGTSPTARGRARAKSGHIAHVNALTGYVQTRRHGRVAFAIIVNDRRADDGPVETGIDRALDILARS